MRRPTGRHPRPRGRDVRLRAVGGRGPVGLGRRRDQGRARRHRRPPARAAPGRRVQGRRASPTRTSSTPTGASARSASTSPSPTGQEIAYELASRSDVFLTNFLPEARQRFNIDVEDIRKANPAIIYARGSALGPRGVEAEPGRLRHDRLLVPRHQRRVDHPAQRGRPDQPAARLRRHDLGHQPGRRHRGGAAQARAHRRALDRRRLAVRQRPVDDGPRPVGLAAPGRGPGWRRRPAAAARCPTRCPASTRPPTAATCRWSCSSRASSGPTSAATSTGPT